MTTTRAKGSDSAFRDFATAFLRGYAVYQPTAVFRFGWREFAGMVADYAPGRLAGYASYLANQKRQLKTRFVDPGLLPLDDMDGAAAVDGGTTASTEEPRDGKQPLALTTDEDKVGSKARTDTPTTNPNAQC